MSIDNGKTRNHRSHLQATGFGLKRRRTHVSVLADVVDPALDRVHLPHQIHHDEIRVHMEWEYGDLDLIIREIPRPELIWVRIQPHIFADLSEASVLATALATNCEGFLVKAGRDP